MLCLGLGLGLRGPLRGCRKIGIRAPYLVAEASDQPQKALEVETSGGLLWLQGLSMCQFGELREPGF